ncbi:MAG: hypothetical protein JRJ87_02090 [Deltaproteobacteria bacterium]|nr:hypothetical protein [Deltaproteobacteria bacterium]
MFDESGRGAGKYRFRGESLEKSLVVRVDLNNYLSWALEQNVSNKVILIEDFLSKMVLALEQHGGFFLSSDSDGIYVVFSEYFGLGAGYKETVAFCRQVVQNRYGTDGLSVRAVVANGPLTFFQRPHEVAGNDWSADGLSLKRAQWLSLSVYERRCIYFFADDFKVISNELPDDFWKKPEWVFRRENIILPPHAVPERTVETVAVEYLKDH